MNVVIATNGQPASEHALREAIRLLALKEKEVFLVSVLDPEQRIGGNENAEGDLERARVICEGAGVRTSSVMRRGAFAHEIVAFAHEKKADLIVLGSTNRNRVSRALLGSVADEVTRHWDKAVLIVRHES
jgi:nucleotide-binding universal stress UspA family protein